MARAPKNPTLPQNNSSSEQKKRNQQILESQKEYVWTTDVQSLKGVPLADGVPFSDEPTLKYLLEVVETVAPVVANALLVKLTGEESAANSAEISTTHARLNQILKETKNIAHEHAHSTASGLLNKGNKSFRSAVHDVESLFGGKSARDRVKAHIEELIEMVQISSEDAALFEAGAGRTLKQYKDQFKLIDLPPIAHTFQSDDEFARLRVAGPNPMLIHGLNAMPDNFNITNEIYQQAMPGDDLDQALGEGRLFMLDYHELSSIKDTANRYLYAPMALFAVPLGGKSLAPVAIQIGQDGGSDPLFLPSQAIDDRWGWEIAKYIVQVADANYHELFAHLARTHLVMEAFVIASHRQLAKKHPVWALLMPHFEGSLFINNAAAGNLIAEGGPISKIFAGTIETLQQAAARDRLNFHFEEKMLPHDLKARNIEKGHSTLEDFPWRDDALLVWEAIRDWAGEYLHTYYGNDSDVKDDYELQNWAKAVVNDGKVKGFPDKIGSIDQLVDICTMIMFTGSAQHAAVNFPQKDFMTFAPAYSGALWEEAPASQSGQDKQGWLSYFPGLSIAIQQVSLLEILGGVHYHLLGHYYANSTFDLQWFRDKKITGRQKPLKKFRKELAKVEATINARNANRIVEYPYQLPSLIPTSINI